MFRWFLIVFNSFFALLFVYLVLTVPNEYPPAFLLLSLLFIMIVAGLALKSRILVTVPAIVVVLFGSVFTALLLLDVVIWPKQTSYYDVLTGLLFVGVEISAIVFASKMRS